MENVYLVKSMLGSFPNDLSPYGEFILRTKGDTLTAVLATGSRGVSCTCA